MMLRKRGKHFIALSIAARVASFNPQRWRLCSSVRAIWSRYARGSRSSFGARPITFSAPAILAPR